MADHYFSPDPKSESRPAQARYQYRGQDLDFITDAGVFSRGEMDGGTDLLLRRLPKLQGRVLDLGCGWGAVGIAVKKADPSLEVTLTDVNSRAAALAKENAGKNGVQVRVLQGDGFQALADERFDFILTNPPIRAGKQVIYGLFAQSRVHLEPGGSLIFVIRRQQGAESAVKYVQTLYEVVTVLKKGGGFWIVQAQKAGKEA